MIINELIKEQEELLEEGIQAKTVAMVLAGMLTFISSNASAEKH